MNEDIFLVSIILPTYNRAHLIEETLNSILKQTYQDWECLIIDDGSSDSTAEILKPYLEKDVRFRYYHRSKKHLKGPSGCRNQGIDLSKGEFIIFFDSDDIIHPDALQICIDTLKTHPGFSYCKYEKQPFRGEWAFKDFSSSRNIEITKITEKRLNDIVTNELAFACCTVMWRKDAIGKLRFDETLSYAEEWEYYIRILSQGIEGGYIKNVLYFNRKHPDSNTGQFWAHNKIRRKSNTLAVIKTIKTLKENNLLNENLKKYFIGYAFFLKSKKILNYVLKHSHKGWISRNKYVLGFHMYPVLRPFLRLKGKLFR